MTHEESITFDALVDRIGELKAQLPKTVYPIYNGCGETDWDCPECEFRSLHREWKFCPQCGGKLNWE